ncbi:unnamed protein product [Urochloa decumbens]|uniref:F-box domain-containing protein n=1 Tax=Urochloa decumbens TaxID=240449 RepID=A0ABC9BE74_9POAL
MADGGSCLPDDVLVQIFLLVPTRFRRPLRLVCKGWRTVIDERAPPEDDKLPAKILVFINHGRTSRALVFDGSSRHRTHEWTYTSSRVSGSVRMIGTCNGLLCLHDHTTYGGLSFSAVTVTNPVTCEAATLPPVPRRWASFAKAPGHYSFGFHRETKLHKVVYIPRGHRRSLDALQVFTLGGKVWRKVPVPIRGACHDLLCEPVSVAGTTYWLAAGAAGRVMALNLGEDERVASLKAPPAMMAAAPTRLAGLRDTSWRLTKVGASLGVVVPSPGMPLGRADVWVLDLDGGGGGAGKPRPQWSRRYSVDENIWSSWIVAPQLTHGDYVLSEWHGWNTGRWRKISPELHRHEVGELAGGGGDGEGWRWQLPPANGKQLIVSSEELEGGEVTTFAYVETRNPVPRKK